ncbi:MAG: hypothetical protein K2K26_09570 [Muribaculaceae bacterium]|nr:hypothetical protein [Muribaculaceae bacterium]
MFSPASATYVDGILNLHGQLDDACKTAYDYSRKFFANLDLVEPAHEERQYLLFIDFTESQPSNAVKGYFVFNKTIHRFLSINIDYAVFFPVRDHSGWDDAAKRGGITIAKIREFQRKREKVIITLTRKKDSRISKPLYVASAYRENQSIFKSNVIDDIGNPYYFFPDIERLQAVVLPKALKSITYSLVGKQYYAPLSTKIECYCVLLAQKDNEYDHNAIKVLRWFPEKRTVAEGSRRIIISAKDQLTLIKNRGNQGTRRLNTIRVLEQRKKKIQELEEIVKGLDGLNGHYFFELGYISRNENAALHKFMVDNESRLLFGKIDSENISLMGGIEIFFSNDFDFPLCLSNILVK